MGDLAERLRKIGATDPFGYNTMTVAADEIERLRAELKSADKLISHLNRQALKGADDETTS